MSKKTITPIEVYTSLNKTNCGDCNEKTCFAFASMVSQGQKKISDCPYLTDVDLEKFTGTIKQKKSWAEEQETSWGDLEHRVSELDFTTIANLIEAEILNNEMVITCLGKNFYINKNGHISSEIHVHSWIKGPLLQYVLTHSNVNPSGKWIVFRQLPSGKKWNPLYMQRCEKPLLKVADDNRELFFHVTSLFGKETMIDGILADFTVIVYPLPKIPFLISYSKSEEGFESQLVFYYDEKAEDIINIESIYSLATGLSIMLEKIIKRHR